MSGSELTTAVIRAREVVRDLTIRAPSEILIEEMAFAYGAIVRYEVLGGADGRLVRLGSRAIIRVRADIPEPGRQRFVIAHELGHFLLGHGADILRLCDEQDLLEWTREQRPYENEANEFAAEVLMPEQFFRARCETGNPSLKVIGTLADEFQTTFTATAIRYVGFSPDRCAAVFTQHGRIRWNRSSGGFPYWLLRKGELHEFTYARDCLDGKPVPDRMSQVSATGWLPGLQHHNERTVWEQSRLISRRLGITLSLLWLPDDDD